MLMHHYKPRRQAIQATNPHAPPELQLPPNKIPYNPLTFTRFEHSYLNSSSVTPRSSVIAANLGYENEGVISIIDRIFDGLLSRIFEETETTESTAMNMLGMRML